MSPHTSSAYISTISRGHAVLFNRGSPTLVKAGPFQVALLTPSIRVCAGCRGSYNRDASSLSYYVILVRKEQHLQQPSNVHTTIT